MNILMFSDYFFPHIGGVEAAVHALARRLVQRGHNVQLLTLNTDRTAAREVVDGIVVHRAQSIELTRFVRMQTAFSVEALPWTARIIREGRPDGFRKPRAPVDWPGRRAGGHGHRAGQYACLFVRTHS